MRGSPHPTRVRVWISGLELPFDVATGNMMQNLLLFFAVTLLTGLISDFDFDGFGDGPDGDNAEYYFGYFIVALYLFLASIILLNLLIAMMATTYQHIGEDTTATIVFLRFELAVLMDRHCNFMAPPLSGIHSSVCSYQLSLRFAHFFGLEHDFSLNVVVIIAVAFFYVVDTAVNFFKVTLCGGTYCDIIQQHLTVEAIFMFLPECTLMDYIVSLR